MHTGDLHRSILSQGRTRLMPTLRALCALCVLIATVSVSHGADTLADRLLPRPHRLTRLSGSVRLTDNGAARACIARADAESAAIDLGIEELNAAIEASGGEPLAVVTPEEAARRRDGVVWVGTRAQAGSLRELLGGRVVEIPPEARVADGYVIECTRVPGRHIVACMGEDERGCYYGLQTLIQALDSDGRDVELPRIFVADRPTYRVRLVKVSGTKGDRAVAAEYAKLLPRYGINVYALQYHDERDGSWREPSEEFLRLVEAVGTTAVEGGVLEPALFVCPYFPPQIDVTEADDVEAYLDRFRHALEHGFRWVEVDFNDWGRWDELSEAERERFENAGAYMAHLTNIVHDRLREQFPDTGVILCPMIGWYHGEAKPEMTPLCREIPGDVLVYWTGPRVRSRHITQKQVRAWTEVTGRKPFLWDNTIYAHFQPYWVGYAFNPYRNVFPEDFHELLAGPGVHLNANAAPHYLPGMMTFADFLWNPDAYDPARSIRNALRLCWGEAAPEVAQSVQDRLVAIHRLLYEAGRGWVAFDREEALAMVDELEQAVERLAEVADDERLGNHLRGEMVASARSAVESFEPPHELTPRPPVTERPLSEGVVNPSAEELADGRPVGWSLYTGAGVVELTVSDDAHSGDRSVCVQATEWYHNPEHAVHGDRRWINVALVHGSELGGFDGSDAYDVAPASEYRFSFWLKGDAPEALVELQGWWRGFAPGSRHNLPCDLDVIVPTDEWTRYEGTFTTYFDTRKVALKIGLRGYADEGMRLGTLCVDDVMIEPVE